LILAELPMPRISSERENCRVSSALTQLAGEALGKIAGIVGEPDLQAGHIGDRVGIVAGRAQFCDGAAAPATCGQRCMMSMLLAESEFIGVPS
jgi:hypothetical protein